LLIINKIRNIKWHILGEDKVNRISYTKRYDIDSHGRPKNPIGRTGITGRGHLGIKNFKLY
jgi:hypothetical protein